MDVIFDIDGTLANAAHRLHFIEGETKDWETFLSDEQIAHDAPIEQTWEVLTSLVAQGHQILFATGRHERQRVTTYDWLKEPLCPIRRPSQLLWKEGRAPMPLLFMRHTDKPRIPSAEMKKILLEEIRGYGFDPVMAFEDRATDTAAWRENGLLCCQVAEGNY